MLGVLGLSPRRVLFFPLRFRRRARNFPRSASSVAPSLPCWTMSQNSCCFSYCRGTGAKDSEHPERASQSRVGRAVRSAQPALCLRAETLFSRFLSPYYFFTLHQKAGRRFSALRGGQCSTQHVYTGLASYFALSFRGAVRAMGKKNPNQARQRGVLDPDRSPKKQPHMLKRNPENPLSRPPIAERLSSCRSSGQASDRLQTGPASSPKHRVFEQSGYVWSACSRYALLSFRCNP